MRVVDPTSKIISADLLIIGAGPAGLAAALAASGSAKNIVLLDENSEAGGQIWRRNVEQTNPKAWQIVSQLVAQSSVQMLFSARVVAFINKKCLLIETPDGTQQLHWEKLILCNGARELLLPFPGWTLPGVTGAGGLQALIKSGANLQGMRVVIAGSGPLLLAVAASVIKAHGKLLMIAEQRSAIDLLRFSIKIFFAHRQKFWQALFLLWAIKPWRYRHSTTISAAHGDQQLKSVTITQAGKNEQIACDLLACGFGLRANLELAELLQCQIKSGVVVVDENQRTSREDVWAAGEVTSIGGVEKALLEGRIAGHSAVSKKFGKNDIVEQRHASLFSALLQTTFLPDPVLRKLCKPDTLVCRCEDVTARELEKFSDWRTAKLMTRVGMGACQGKLCGGACEFLYGWDIPAARQPVFPAKAASLALLADIQCEPLDDRKNN